RYWDVRWQRGRYGWADGVWIGDFCVGDGAVPLVSRSRLVASAESPVRPGDPPDIDERVATLPVGASFLPRRGERLAGRPGLFSRHDRGRSPAGEEGGWAARAASPART